MDRVTVNGAPRNEIYLGLLDAASSVTGASAPVAILNAESVDRLVVNGGAGNDGRRLQPPLGTMSLTLDGGNGDEVSPPRAARISWRRRQ